jgi:Macrocin-O-methyltransferase (TylF)
LGCLLWVCFIHRSITGGGTSTYDYTGFGGRGNNNNNDDDDTGRRLIRRTFAALNNDDLKSIMKPFTMTGPLHIDLALSAVEKLNNENIQGAIVECGVWKGGVSMGMMMVNLRHNLERDFYLFDTFEGLPEPTDEKNGRHAQKLFNSVNENGRPKRNRHVV